MTPSRKTLIAIGIGVLTLIILVSGYFFLHRSTPTQTGGTLPSNPSSNTGTISSNGSIGQQQTAGDTQSGSTSGGEPALFQIHDKPIVSFVLFTRDGGTFTRFMEQGSGNVFEYNVGTKEKKRTSNTSIPQIGSAVWSRNGNTVVFQYVESGILKTAIGELATSSVEGSFKKITFMPDGMRSVVLSPDGTSIAYVLTNAQGAQIVVAKKNGAGAHTVFSSPLTHWLLSWPGNTNLTIETPLSLTGGAAYQINPSTGAQKILLTTQTAFPGVLSASDANAYLAASSLGGTTQIDNKTGASFDGFAINTIPDKCSFIATSTSYAICGTGKSGSAPIVAQFESWLRGEFLSDDVIAVIGFKNATWTMPLKDSDLGDKKFDIEHIETSNNASFGAFKEKAGGILWGLHLDNNLFR